MALMPNGAALADDQLMLVEAARDFAQNELLALDRSCDENESSICSILPKLSDMGLLALSLPPELNGLGCNCRTYASIIHEISVASPSTAVTIAVHNMVGNLLRKSAGESLRTQWLTQWNDPASFSAFAVSEAGAGSDVRSAKTRAVRVKDGFRVRGEKMWITNGLSARWFIVLARMEDIPDDQGLCALLIDGNEPGVERSPIKGKMGIRGSETAVIHFNDVFVPESHLIGEVGRGIQVFLTSLNEGRIGIATQATGIAEACLNEMISYARQREQFGRPIGSFQAVANMIADSAVELEAAKILIWNAAAKVDADRPDPSATSMAKLYATEKANDIAYRAVQVHGGAGYVHECRVEQLYRDARVTTIYEGTSEIQRLVIARRLAS